MKRLLQLGGTPEPFFLSSGGATLGLLFVLTALLVATTAPRSASAISQERQVMTAPPFVGTHSETWEEFGAIVACSPSTANPSS